jgi:hypothetical protein
METNELIQRIAANSVAVRPLPAPWIRVALWLAISVPYVAAIVLVNPMRAGLAQAMSDQQFLIEQGAILATVLAAAVAAFCSTIPGYNRKILFLPLLPLAVWLASLGEGCVRDWVERGADGLRLRPDWGCLPSAALIGVIPAIAMVFMLRKGAPLFPRVTIALGALAVAALGNFGLRLFHVGDASIMVLFWHFGGVALLAVLAAGVGRQVFHWGHAGAGW